MARRLTYTERTRANTRAAALLAKAFTSQPETTDDGVRVWRKEEL